MAYETFESVEGIIQSINRGDSCCTMMVSLISNSNIVNVVVTGDTTIVDNVRLRPGMRIAAFYDANLLYRRCIRPSIAQSWSRLCAETSR